MQIIISVLLLVIGIAILIMIHVCIVGRAFRGDYISGRISIPGRVSRIPGLSSVDLKQLTCFDYKADEKGNSSVECVVCLENFKGGEKCRMLPICNHIFHVQCIDSWLLKTAACPICRTRANTLQIGEENSRSSGIGVELV